MGDTLRLEDYSTVVILKWDIRKTPPPKTRQKPQTLRQVATSGRDLVPLVRVGRGAVVTLSVPATVLSLVGTLGDERVRAGHYSVQFGVEGSAEGPPELASLEVDGEDVLIFSYEKLKREM